MKNIFMFILLSFVITFGYTIEYTMTAAQAIKLAEATVALYPIKQINTGTVSDPVWEDSCTAEEWTIKHYKDEMRKTWKRHSKKIKTDTIQADPW